MSQLINIYDDGFTKDRKGRNVGAIRFRIVTREGKPDDILAYCLPAYKDAVIKNLRRLAFQKRNQANLMYNNINSCFHYRKTAL